MTGNDSPASLSEIVKLLRDREELSVEDLAARLGITVGEIADLEAGLGDASIDRATAIANVTTHSLMVAVWREHGDAEQRWVRRALHELLTRLLVETDTTADAHLTLEGLGPTAYVCLGLLGASREVLRSLMILDVVGQSLHVAPNLVRQIFEYVATAEWILEDPEARTVQLYQATNRDLREMGALDSRWEEVHQERRALWARIGIPEDEFAERLPGFRERLTGAMKEEGWYIRYREFCTHSHPTLFVVEDALVDEPPLRFRTEANCRLDWLAMAGCLVWSLALLLRKFAKDSSPPTLGYGGDLEEFAQLGVMLNKFTNDAGIRELHDAILATLP